MGNPVIFQGSKLKALKKEIQLGTGASRISGTVDPTSSAVSAVAGSIYQNETSGKVYRKLDAGSSTNWVEVKESTEKNYIANGDALLDTSGWSTYADVAGAQPVDGTGNLGGGTPHVTWTRTTSSPLSGPASFLFTKDAANRQGQGVSYDFTVDRADEGSILFCPLVMQPRTGTYSGGSSTTDSDLTVYIVSKEFGTVIQPSYYKLQGAVNDKVFKAVPVFQVPVSAGGANARQFRLCIHVSTTSASAYTVAFDQIKVTPDANESISSPIVSKYYHTIGTTLSPGDIINFNSKSIDYQAAVTTGASWKYTAQEPGAYEINAYIESNAFVAASGDRWALELFKNGSLVDHQGRLDAESTNYQIRSATAIFVIELNAGDYIDVRYNSSGVTFPLVGASGYSNIAIKKISSQSNGLATGNLIAVKYCGSGGQSITANSTNITFSEKLLDTCAAWNGSVFTAPEPGLYAVLGSLQVTSSTSAFFSIYVNGSLVDGSLMIGANITTDVKGIHNQVWLNSGDTLSIRSDSGVTLQTLSASNRQWHWISIVKVSNQAQIGANEPILARAYTATAGSYNAGDNIVWDGKSYDTHNAFDISTGKFTAPAPGRYRAKAQIRFQSASNTQGDTPSFILEKNDADYAYLDNYLIPYTGSFVLFFSGEATVQLNAGDTCNVYAAGYGGTRGLTTNAGINYIEIERVG